MTPEEIEELIDKLSDFTLIPDPLSTASAAARALRFLLKEREDLVQATAEGRLTPNGQLHASPEHPVSEDEMRSALDAAVQDAGSQKAWAKANDISEQYVCDCLKGRRHIGFGIAKAFGYEPITVYVRVAPPQSQGDRPELPSDGQSRETKTSGENP